MVVFTCNHCGDSLQKPRVEKHYQFTCRTVKSLTCVDCFKDFKGEEYVVHTKCITEEERYAAKGSVVNSVKKGEVKQQSWTEMVRSILDGADGMPVPHRRLLESVAQCTNVPRKKQKFMNFVKSSSGGRANMKDVEAVWDIIEKHKASNNASEPKPQTQIKENSVPNGKTPTKRKAEDEATVDTKQPKIENGESDKFSYEEKIEAVLKKKGGSMTKEKLQKKVLAAYLKHHGLEEYTPKQIKKFNKRLKKMNNVRMADDNVSLVE